ncbi:MAG: sialidase family protein [Planctomycetota bacterium]|jgi:hypothetical protein|nr:sialidase family protein [Planctomycetota bacterium]
MSATTSSSYTGDIVDLSLIDELGPNSPYDCIWQPFVVRSANGKRLIATYGGRLRGKADMGDVLCRVSDDDGQTWWQTQMVFDHHHRLGDQSVAYANSVLYRPPGQSTLWCFAMRCPMHRRDSEDSQLCAAYSADDGGSWVPVEITNHHASPLITCAGIVQHGDRYLLPVHRNTLRRDPCGDRRQFVLESRNLLEWSLAGYVPFPEAGPCFVHEGGLAAAADGSLSMVMRSAAYSGDARAMEPPVAYRSESQDGGRTWTPAEAQGALHNTVAKGAFAILGDGREIYVYSDGVAWERPGLSYVVRPVGGVWSEPRPFYDGGNRNSYATLIEDPATPGLIEAVWDSSHNADCRRTQIRFGRLRLG